MFFPLLNRHTHTHKHKTLRNQAGNQPTIHTLKRKTKQRNPWGSFCAGQGPWPWGLLWSVWLIDPLPLHWRKWAFLLDQLSVANSFLARSGTLCPLPFFPSGTLSGLNLCRSCPWHSFWVHVCFSLAIPNTCDFLGIVHNFWLCNLSASSSA